MTNELSSFASQIVSRREIGELFLVLLRLEHPQLEEDIRVVHDSVPLTSREEEYLPFPFTVSFPDEDEDGGTPSLQLQISNVDNRIRNALRSIHTPFTATIEVVVASNPDVVENGPWVFRWENVSVPSKTTLSGHLTYEPVLSYAGPVHRMTPQYVPGIFR